MSALVDRKESTEEREERWHSPVAAAEVEYGAFAKGFPVPSGAQPFYLTTAIAYTNGYPHMGHAYEFLSSDIIVRYYRMLGYDTYFLTGSDEHGQKVASSAEKAGREPLQHCDLYVRGFKALNQRLLVSNDDYLRTTDARHKQLAQKLWVRCADRGDIYLGAYEGWYNEREEVFVTDSEAEAAAFLDPGSGLPLKRVKEESYFFRMGEYAERLLAHIETHPEFIQPEQYRNNILGRLAKEGLRDLSLSRTSFSWGIPLPDGFDKRHVMYVWFDALSNYLTGVCALEPDHPLSRFWPANVHVIGKDIIWFHCVIWPCMLLSAELPLPTTVYSHGFVNAADGRKMSKSFDNATDPNEVLDRFPADSVRYYAASSVTFGADLSFSEASLVTMHNSELADILGNLVNRALNLCLKYCAGRIPAATHDPSFALPFDLGQLVDSSAKDLSTFSINAALFRAMDAARDTNRFLTAAEPWKMKGSDEGRRAAVVRTTLEAIYAFTHFLAPTMPIAAAKIFRMLGTAPVTAGQLRQDLLNLRPGTAVVLGEILFQKIEAAQDKCEPVKPKPAPVLVVEDDPNQPDFSKIELRVGRITKVWPHETAERLYCEEIDVGEDQPRAVASGLRQQYSLEELQSRLVVVVCNLKEAKMQGFASSGMVLAAKSEAGKVELVNPPAGSVVGERVVVEGVTGSAWSANKVKKNKVWEAVAADLSTTADCRAAWKGLPLLTASGECSVATLASSPIA